MSRKIFVEFHVLCQFRCFFKDNWKYRRAGYYFLFVCFLFYQWRLNILEPKNLHKIVNELTNRMWFSIVCTLFEKEYKSLQWSKICCRLTRCSRVYVSLSIRVQATLNHIRFVFYHNINVKENVFFRGRAEKSIAWHIDESSVVWTLLYNGKLTNQIAR